MGNIFRKLRSSTGNITIILWVAVFAYVYQIDYTKKPKVQKTLAGRTVEEIIATPVDKTSTPAWDKDFKSAVEPI